jgi:cyanate lyase
MKERALTPIMSKSEAADLVVSAKIRLGLTWRQIAASIDAPLVWTTAALLGQHPVPQAQARKVCGLLELDESVVEGLRLQPARGADEAVMNDPTVYRFVEAISVYGPALKELIHEEFGDGIMSAINFKVDIARRPDPDGDRVVVTFDGKFLDYRW